MLEVGLLVLEFILPKHFIRLVVYEEDGITVRNPDEFATGNWCILSQVVKLASSNVILESGVQMVPKMKLLA